MSAIVDLLSAIGDAIVFTFDLIISLLSDLVYIVQLLGKIAVQLPNYFSWLPAPVSALILVTFAIVIIYKITGREG